MDDKEQEDDPLDPDSDSGPQSDSESPTANFDAVQAQSSADSPSSDSLATFGLSAEPQSNGGGDAGKRKSTYQPGDEIGPYKLRQRLGEGGMGEVWAAEQRQPVKRMVALKLIKGGASSQEVLARFEVERQALALMNHPNIARILDAGTTDRDQPYFVMELVGGEPITTYCDQNRLNISDRLNLFIQVCFGIQHAHQKGIIHRDLKPSNILVGTENGKPIPKVIDFGLAKAIESSQRLTDHSLYTGIGQVLGTLKYMSPEQARLNNIDIDTRTDVYALGIILYELLTGSTPLDDATIKGQALLSVLELIRDQEPIKPSSKLSSNRKDVLSSVTDKRRTDSQRLSSILQGELDWIVMKALEKDRARRYATVTEISDDLHRFLTNQPVLARPPSLNYRLTKFIKRNRLLVVSSGAVLAALVLGLVSTTVQMRRAQAAERVAEERRKEAEEYAEMLTQADAKSVDLINELTRSIDDKLEGAGDFSQASGSLGFGMASPEMKVRLARIRLLMRLGLLIRIKLNNREQALPWFKAAVDEFEKLEEQGLLLSDLEFGYSVAIQNYTMLARLEPDESIRYTNKEIELARKVYNRKPQPTELSIELLARAYLNAGVRHLGEQGLRYTTEGIDLVDSLPSAPEDAKKAWARMLINRADEFLMPSRVRTAEEAAEDVRRAYEYLQDTDLVAEKTRALTIWVLAAESLKRSEESEELLRKLDQTIEFGKAASATTYGPKANVASQYFNRGFQYHLASELDQAVAQYEKAAQLLEECRSHSMEIVRTQTFLRTNWNYASALMTLGRIEESTPHWQRALDASQWSRDPNERVLSPVFKIRLMTSQYMNDPKTLVREFESYPDFARCNAPDYPVRVQLLFYAVQLFACAASNATDDESRKAWIDRAYEFLEVMKQNEFWIEDAKQMALTEPFTPILLNDPRSGEYFE